MRRALLAVAVLAVVTACDNATSGTVIGKVYDDDCWQLHLRDMTGQKGRICVDHATWSRVNIGDTFGLVNT